MQELIKITENSGKKAVSAKELYLGLGLNKAVWSRWYPTNIQENDFFLENEHWVGVQHNVEGNETMDFAISIDFAKHIAMMARTEKSHEYRNYFLECEKKLRKPVSALEALAQTVAALQEQEKRLSQIETTQLAIKEAVISQPDNWREDIRHKLNSIVQALGENKFREVRSESYKLLEQRAGVNLGARLINKQARMLNEGVSNSNINKVGKIDIIEEDKKLREIYSKIVSEYIIRYVA
jgi:anti-repressor protein